MEKQGYESSGQFLISKNISKKEIRGKCANSLLADEFMEDKFILPDSKEIKIFYCEHISENTRLHNENE